LLQLREKFRTINNGNVLIFIHILLILLIKHQPLNQRNSLTAASMCIACDFDCKITRNE